MTVPATSDDEPAFIRSTGYLHPRNGLRLHPAFVIFLVLGGLAGFGALGWVLFGLEGKHVYFSKQGVQEVSKDTPVPLAKTEPSNPRPSTSRAKGPLEHIPPLEVEKSPKGESLQAIDELIALNESQQEIVKGQIEDNKRDQAQLYREMNDAYGVKLPPGGTILDEPYASRASRASDRYVDAKERGKKLVKTLGDLVTRHEKLQAMRASAK
jgi:hypothetical protein